MAKASKSLLLTYKVMKLLKNAFKTRMDSMYKSIGPGLQSHKAQRKGLRSSMTSRKEPPSKKLETSFRVVATLKRSEFRKTSATSSLSINGVSIKPSITIKVILFK